MNVPRPSVRPLVPVLAGLLLVVPAGAQQVSGTGITIGGVGTAGPGTVNPGAGPQLPGTTTADDLPTKTDADTPSLNQDLIPGALGKPLGHTAVGHFNNDDYLDVIVLVDQKPVVLSGREIFRAYDKPWNTPILAFDTYPGAGPDGQDAIVFSDAAGLHFAWWDFVTKSFKTLLVEGDTWAGAQHVRVGDVDGVGRIDVIGISADARALLVMSANSANPPVFTPVGGFTTDSEIRTFTTVEWDGLGLPEIAFVTDDALEVRDFDGTLRQQWSGVPGGGWLTPIRQGYLPNDRLTWVTPSTVDPQTQVVSQFVFTVDKDVLDIAVDASGTFVTSVESGDWDGDGDDDLIVGYGFSHDLIVMSNERSAGDPSVISFSPASEAWSLPVGPPSTQNFGQLANVVMGDFDNDGDVDGAIAVQSSGEFRVGKNDHSAYSDDYPVVSRLRYIVTEGSSTGDLKIKIERPLNLPTPKTELQIVQWRQDRVSGPSEPTPISTEEFSIVRWPTEVTIQVEEPGQYFTSVYYLEMRFGSRMGEPSSVSYRSPSIGGFTLSQLSLTQLAKTPGTGAPVTVVPEGDLTFGTGEAGSLGGAYIPHLRVPPTSGLNYN